jgi:hypothetical protein
MANHPLGYIQRNSNQSKAIANVLQHIAYSGRRYTAIYAGAAALRYIFDAGGNQKAAMSRTVGGSATQTMLWTSDVVKDPWFPLVKGPSDVCPPTTWRLPLGETRYQSSLQRQSTSLDQTISIVSATPISKPNAFLALSAVSGFSRKMRTPWVESHPRTRIPSYSLMIRA